MAAAIPAGREHWSSPQQQLEILLKPITEELASAGLPVSHLAAIVAEYADANIAALAERVRWITPEEQLERLFKPITEEVVSAGLTLLSAASMVSEYVGGNFGNWHTALKRLDMLPEAIPPLPLDIHEILEQRCAIRGDETKEDGICYSVNDTHSLYLMPGGTVNELAARMKACGREYLAEYEGVNPLRIGHFYNGLHLGDTGSNEPQWMLISNRLLEGSCDKSYREQVIMVAELSERAFANYKIPSIKQSVAFAFFHQVATRESFLQADSAEHLKYTYVQETTVDPVGAPMIVGGVDGRHILEVDHRHNSGHDGVLVVRQL